MRIGLDGIPLVSPKTGIGHYTFELAQSLARIAPADEFQLISPIPFMPSSFEQNGDLPSNLYKVSAKRRRLWWAVGLPLYVRQSSLSLFHGTNYDIPFWISFPTVV